MAKQDDSDRWALEQAASKCQESAQRALERSIQGLAEARNEFTSINFNTELCKEFDL